MIDAREVTIFNKEDHDVNGEIRHMLRHWTEGRALGYQPSEMIMAWVSPGGWHGGDFVGYRVGVWAESGDGKHWVNMIMSDPIPLLFGALSVAFTMGNLARQSQFHMRSLCNRLETVGMQCDGGVLETT